MENERGCMKSVPGKPAVHQGMWEQNNDVSGLIYGYITGKICVLIAVVNLFHA